MTTPELFDDGLQPQRTVLAWRRTALAIAIGSVVSMRLLTAVFAHPGWVIPGVLGVGFAGWLWMMSYRRFARASAPSPGAASLIALAAFVVAAGALGVATVMLAGSGLP